MELVTLFSVLLVGFDNTAGALEAAWKWLILTIMGAPIALFGFLTLFWAFHSTTGGTMETWEGLRVSAASMNPDLLKLSFLLDLCRIRREDRSGADAHLVTGCPQSGAYAGMRHPLRGENDRSSVRDPALPVVILASPEARLGHWMVVLGLISVGLAAFLLLQVRDYKRMFAFSTVEHMGIILTAAGLATQAADYGAVLQMLNHAITKSLCFYVAGVILLTISTREIASVRGLFRISPFAASALLFCSLAIAGAPPFPIFLSEFSILSAGLRAGQYAVVAILATLIVIAFVAILMHVNQMVFGEPGKLYGARKALPASCRVAVVAAALPVIVLGVYIPAPVNDLLQLAAHQLGGH